MIENYSDMYKETKEHKDKYQPLLDKLLIQSMKELKKQMFPRKHIKLLYNEIDIAPRELNKETMGIFEFDELKHYKYKYHIFVSYYVLNKYLDYDFCKRAFKREIKDVIKHELIHAYVLEEHEYCTSIKGTYFDSSPIFLSILAYLGVPSGHKAMRSFKHTDLFKKIKACNTFNELEDTILVKIIINHERRFKTVETMMDKDRKTIFCNIFKYGYGSTTGIKGSSTLTFTDADSGCLCKANEFEIGPCADIENLESLILKKIKNNSFQYKYHRKVTELTRTDKKDRLHLQTMNI